MFAFWLRIGKAFFVFTSLAGRDKINLSNSKIWKINKKDQ